MLSLKKFAYVIKARVVRELTIAHFSSPSSVVNCDVVVASSRFREGILIDVNRTCRRRSAAASTHFAHHVAFAARRDHAIAMVDVRSLSVSPFPPTHTLTTARRSPLLRFPLIAVPVVLVLASLSPYILPGKHQRHGAGSQAYDPRTGIGRGAPGFQTNVTKVAIPPDIAARIRAGEDVSAEEITQALEDVKAGRYKPKAEREREEWLPQGVSSGANKGAGSSSKRKGKR